MTLSTETQTGEKQPGDETPTPETFETWLTSQPQEIQSAYAGHVARLQNAVAATRQERDDLKRQIESVRELAKKGEKAGELETTLNEMLGRLEASEKKAAFLEAAGRPDIGCNNPRAAYAIAQQENLFSRNGQPDWAALREAAPELFGKPAAKGNAGAGTSTSVEKTDMNTIIRRMAGIGD